jgi:hypothetical protein
MVKTMKRKTKELDVDTMGTGENLTDKDQALISAFIAAKMVAGDGGANKATTPKVRRKKKPVKKQ